jgi:hypothetical protein
LAHHSQEYGGLQYEHDDVAFFVGGVEPDERASIETARMIEEYKKRPDYRFETEEAARILAALDINPRDYGIEDAKSLLDYWHRCVGDLLKADLGDNHEERVDQENIGIGTEYE